MKFTLNGNLTTSEIFHLAAFGMHKDFKNSLYVEASIYDPLFIKAYVKISKSEPEIISSTTTYGSRMLVTSTKPQKINQNVWENILAGDIKALKALAEIIDFSTIGHCANSYAPRIPIEHNFGAFAEISALNGTVVLDNIPLIREPDPQKLISLAVSTAAKIKFVYGQNSHIHIENLENFEDNYMEILTYA